jgi:hypothetical protein
MRPLRIFNVVIVLVTIVSSTLLFTSCASSTTTGNSQSDSYTYKGHNTGGIGWH